MKTFHSYTLTGDELTVTRSHRVPRGGVARVSSRQLVRQGDSIAFSELPERYKLLDISDIFGVPPAEAEYVISKADGDLIERGELLGERKAFFGLDRRRVVAPFDGKILRKTQGKLLLAGISVRQEVLSPAPGYVVDVEPYDYVMIETDCGLVQLIWATGTLTWGSIRVVDRIPAPGTEADFFSMGFEEAIVIIKEPLTEIFLRGVVKSEIRAIVAPSARASLIPFMRKLPITIGLTEGFGSVEMNEEAAAVFRRYDGQRAAFDSADSRNTRPEIIIPIQTENQTANESGYEPVILPGSRVRILQNPDWGKVGTVTELAEQPDALKSGLRLPGAYVKIPAGKTVFVPFANMQQVGKPLE